PDGNVRNDPHQEFTGRNILYQAHSIAETASRFGVSEDAARARLEEARNRLLAARNERVRPHLDDKILTSWNGLMISALAKGSFALEEPRYFEAAAHAADFITQRMWDGSILLRRYRRGEAAIPGFLDDYAFFAQALLDLYETSGDEGRLRLADQLARAMIERFEDRTEGAFFSTTEEDPSLVMRMKEDYDGAEPSGNSIAILTLLRLARITGNETFRESAERGLRAFSTHIRQAPSGVPQMLVALLYHLSPPKQIVIAGAPADALLEVIRSRFLPFHTLLRAMPLSMIEHVREMREIDGRPAAYVCENFACQLPVSNPEQLEPLLQ
ncbi:MAG TPA: thioredoxin domain-containing protein, partial [Bryobacteraceae bacterium]|nr:thioredoxin domain-containing protein [Bryobacteraceae bacterium]